MRNTDKCRHGYMFVKFLFRKKYFCGDFNNVCPYKTFCHRLLFLVQKRTIIIIIYNQITLKITIIIIIIVIYSRRVELFSYIFTVDKQVLIL